MYLRPSNLKPPTLSKSSSKKLRIDTNGNYSSKVASEVSHGAIFDVQLPSTLLPSVDADYRSDFARVPACLSSINGHNEHTGQFFASSALCNIIDQSCVLEPRAVPAVKFQATNTAGNNLFDARKSACD